MPQSRDPSLPDGLSELVELIDQQQQTDRAMDVLRTDVRIYCRKLAPLIFDELYRLVDHDLLFTTERDLILPRIREVSREVLDVVLRNRRGGDVTSKWMVDIMTEEALFEIERRRPKTS